MTKLTAFTLEMCRICQERIGLDPFLFPKDSKVLFIEFPLGIDEVKACYKAVGFKKVKIRGILMKFLLSFYQFQPLFLFLCCILLQSVPSRGLYAQTQWIYINMIVQ